MEKLTPHNATMNSSLDYSQKMLSKLQTANQGFQ